MIKNKFLLILIFTIFLTGFVFSTPVVKINNELLSYTNTSSSNFFVEVSNTGDNCEVESDFINISISSNATPSFNFPLYCNLSRNYSGYFSINFTLNNPTPPIPSIFVNSQDTVVLTYTAVSASLVVDTVSTVVGTFNLTSLDTNIGNYYKGDANITGISSFSDSHSGLSKYYAYVVPFASLDTYRTNYTKRIIVDSNVTTINLSLLSGVVDGNYYVLLDAIDRAGNLGVENSVKNNKRTLLVDNTAPQVTSFILGDFNAGATYYVPSTTLILTIALQDQGIGIRNEPLFTTQLDRNNVKLADYNAAFGGFYFDFNTVDYDINGSYAFAATDLLGNLNQKIFNILIDENAPTTPTVPTLARAIDNNITISNWGTATDSGSGLKEYRIYRATSSFTTITNQTLVCTVPSASAKTCIDSSSKSDNTTYHYGVSAVDNAGNLSSVISASVKTGPSISMSIDFNYSNYINISNPEIKLEYGSDVNAVRFSCNASTFTSWIEVSNTSTTYNGFNISSGNGCNTDQGEKRLYIEARSEDDPFPITRKSLTYRYDSQAPTVPSNVVATEQTNGSIKLTWNESTDINGSGIKEYRVYYSTSDNVSESSQYLTSTSREYTFRPNVDDKFYFKVSAVDRTLNSSVLSSVVSANSRRFGPTFVFNVNPKNVVGDLTYLKKGVSNFTITTNQVLKQNPIVRLKIGNNSYQTLIPSYNNLTVTLSYDFNLSGNGILEITGTNNNNETSTDTFDFIVDAQIPVFDVNSTYNEETKSYTLFLSNYSSDIFRVQYLLNNTEEVCFIENSDNNFTCVFDTLKKEDGKHKMHVIVYDLALNFDTKIIDVEVDNVDEALLLKENLVKELNENKKDIETRISFLESINFKVSEDILKKLELANEKLSQAISFENNNNFSQAVNEYTSSNNLFLEILQILPKENILKTKTIVIDLVNHKYDLNTVILDQNIILDNSFDENSTVLSNLNVTRDFSVFEISNQNYYSSVLTFKNNSSEDIIISFIEVIPKEFSRLAKDIYFDRSVVVIDEDPIVLYNITIPKNSEVKTRYISKNPITSFDILTKYDGIVYQPPLLLVGFVSKDVLNFKRPLLDSKTIFLISVVFLVIIVLLIVIWLIASSRKKKEDVFLDLSAKEKMNKYLSGKKVEDNLSSIPDNTQEQKSDIEKKDTYDSNYEFILDAVKRSNK